MKIHELYPYWADLHSDVTETLRYMNPLLWDYKPAHIDARSIRQIAVHMIDRERFWIAYVAQGLPWERPASAEFSSTEALVDSLESTRESTLRYIDGLDPGMLRTVRAVPDDAENNLPGANMPLAGVIWQVVEHEIYHYGQICLRMQE